MQTGFLLSNDLSEEEMRVPVIDAHCDTLTVLSQQNRTLGITSNQGHLDLPRLRKGKVNVQFFAIFVSPEYNDDPVKYTEDIIEQFNKELAINSDLLSHVCTYDEIHKSLLKDKTCAILTIEGGEALKGKIEKLDDYFNLGVRGLTLTWNGRNELGDGVGLGTQASGLTVFGREVVERMSELGMIIDVSHLSETGFWDVISEVRVPIAATHSNCKEICDHPRNLTDQQIRSIAEKGGVIGVTYVPQFIDINSPSIDKLMDHIDHLYQVGGVSCIGLGSDFDGIDITTKGLHDCSVAVPNIENALIKRGYTTGQIELILGDNWLRIVKDICR